MPHQSHLDKKKYRNWVQAGLGLKYVKEGLQMFCEDIAKQQHADIVYKIKQQKNLSTVACGQCCLKDLMPDHKKFRNKQCPLGQVNCNCLYPKSKTPCPNKVCGAIYDQIIQCHGSTPPAPYWRNTYIQNWCTDPWAIAKCFINAPGYDQMSSAAETDCSGLLHLIINNKEFHNHIQCNITGTDVFSKVKEYRNKLFHSSTMELHDVDVKSYIADMIAVLQDCKELNSRPDTQAAVMNLQELGNEDFIITTKCEAEVFSASIETIKMGQKGLEEKIDVSERKTKKIEDNLPTKEDVEQLEQRVLALEHDISEQKDQIKTLNKNHSKLKEDLENLKSVQSLHKTRSDYVQNKIEFQREMITFYKDRLLKVSIIPLKPRSNLTNFSNVYTVSRMTAVRNKANAQTGAKQTEEIEISSMKELFMKDGRPIKSVYVVGEAGSGKSTFCRSLVNSWCLAHSEQQTNKDEFDGIEEMRKYEFLFHIPLSHTSDKTSIREMLWKIYGRPVLDEIMDNESGSCLILLDGLDEWTPQTKEPSPFQTVGLPIQEHFKNFTVITTSRPWKLETLQITENEIQLKVNLKEFSEIASKNLVGKTVSILNDIFKGNKLAADCENQIEDIPVSDIKRTPIMLQQLICLWYDGKLTGTSRCAIYSAMLELFFKWNAGKVENESCFVKMRELAAGLRNTKLPEYLKEIEACKRNLYLIEDMSRLAYETLFNNKKEISVAFDSSSFERFEISDNVKDCCLKLGILSEDKEESLVVSQSLRSIYSFVHKSEQEFLAAVYITMHAHTIHAQTMLDNRSIQFLDEYLKCVTVEDILDKENVLIMLSGLEPRLATYISEYVYNIVKYDKRVLKYRTSVNVQYLEIISNIENCIYNCIDEVLARNTNCESRFHLGDVLIDTKKYCDRFLMYCDKKSIASVYVTSMPLYFQTSFTTVPINAETMNDILKYVLDCRQLATFKVDLRFSEDKKWINSESMQCIRNILEANVSTLQFVSVELPQSRELNHIYATLIHYLPSMSRLVALKINRTSVSHDQCYSLCSFLSRTEHLEQILIDINCDCRGKHNLDLSKHKNLRSLALCTTFCLISANSSHLEHLKYVSFYRGNVGQVCDILFTAYNLKHLQLYSHSDSDDNEAITKKLKRLLPSLHQLRELRLSFFILTDNIITCPSEMKYLERIVLSDVIISVTTWRKFVDSLTAILHSVKVVVSLMCITRDGEEGDRSRYELLKGGGEEAAAAFQYIRDQGALFTVDGENVETRYITFSTNK